MSEVIDVIYMQVCIIIWTTALKVTKMQTCVNHFFFDLDCLVFPLSRSLVSLVSLLSLFSSFLVRFGGGLSLSLSVLFLLVPPLRLSVPTRLTGSFSRSLRRSLSSRSLSLFSASNLSLPSQLFSPRLSRGSPS